MRDTRAIYLGTPWNVIIELWRCIYEHQQQYRLQFTLRFWLRASLASAFFADSHLRLHFSFKLTNKAIIRKWPNVTLFLFSLRGEFSDQHVQQIQTSSLSNSLQFEVCFKDVMKTTLNHRNNVSMYFLIFYFFSVWRHARPSSDPAWSNNYQFVLFVFTWPKILLGLKRYPFNIL